MKYIKMAAQEVIDGKLNDQFPVRVWQTGSGTHSNVNVCEVIANLANKMMNGKNGEVIRPLDDVNMSQSSNDTFTSAMHIAAAWIMKYKLITNVKKLRNSIQSKVDSDEFKNTVKVGRTHLQDATPISFSQEFSGYVAQIDECLERINQAIKDLSYLPIGGTAVGTGLNTGHNYDKNGRGIN